MKKILLATLFLTIIACDSVTEKTIYTVNDPEWDLVAALQAKQCVNKSSLFKEMTKYSDFSKSRFSVGDIFKISQDEDNPELVYVRVNAITATEIILEYNSSNNDLKKIASFSNTEYEKLQIEFEEAFCQKQFEDFIQGSTSSGSFRWRKYRQIEADDNDDNDIDEAFIEVVENLKINFDYPLFFYFYNGTKAKTQILEDGGTENSFTSKITITKANDDENCEDAEGACVFTGALVSNCSIAVDENAIDDFLETSTTVDTANIIGASDCVLLESSN